MKLKVFTLRMKPETGIFDDKELSEFQLGKDVLEVSEHFLVHEKTPTLTLVLRYRELPDGASRSPEAVRKDWRAELDLEGKRIYDELRLWRGRKAKREGMPPYLILNNRELAELAMKKPATLANLRDIEGIGEAKSERWGEEILALLASLAPPPPAKGERPAPSGTAAPMPPKNPGGGVIHGFRRASPLRPLGEDAQGYPLAH
ncbi:MAG: HRDC domain-containing protein [Elusimicrobia bacterium]|nr:HRDC domain-containing protein [Elusimicrobiota bacterium]